MNYGTNPELEVADFVSVKNMRNSFNGFPLPHPDATRPDVLRLHRCRGAPVQRRDRQIVGLYFAPSTTLSSLEDQASSATTARQTSSCPPSPPTPPTPRQPTPPTPLPNVHRAAGVFWIAARGNGVYVPARGVGGGEVRALGFRKMVLKYKMVLEGGRPEAAAAPLRFSANRSLDGEALTTLISQQRCSTVPANVLFMFLDNARPA
jgi:hypothetical protein